MTKNYTFRTSDFLPTAIGFDRILKQLEDVFTESRKATYPPYNIRSLGDNKYVIQVAVAGFKESELTVTVEDNTLTVAGGKAEEEESYLYKGIATREFKRTFTLEDSVEVTGAKVENGILSIELENNLPPKKMPKLIPILNSNA